jgi:hypothetical protein
MQRTLPTVASLVLLAAPAWSLAAQVEPCPPDREAARESVVTNDENRQVYQEQGQGSQGQQAQIQEQQALSQKPAPSPDSKLYMEIYTDQNYSK